jgi:PAS domain S-box-containing protein
MAAGGRPPQARGARPRYGLSLEHSILLLAIIAGLPSGLAVIFYIWTQPYGFEARWTVTAIVLAVWLGAAATAYQMVNRVLLLQANLLGALREGDYSIRGTGARPGSAVALVMHEINVLGDTLQRQRTEAVESTALLQSVMAAIDVAVFALDMDGRLVLVNAAAERLIGQPASKVLGSDARQLRLADYLTGETPRLIDRPFGPESGRLELRRSTFRRDGKPHQLLVFADLSRALREEEQQAWQRIVRVLSHEINNSLTPIKSIAHSIKRMLARVPDLPRGDEIEDGLTLIEARSGSLGRFLRAYAQLARLPKPQLGPVPISAIVQRIAELENRLPVGVRSGEPVVIQADADQIEQLLINVVRNAVDASLDTRGRVSIDWRTVDGSLQLTVEDEGPGLPDTSNLFVPFFTTKPAGSGIGLALSRQIAEAHGGTLVLENRPEGKGCRAVLRLPL